MHQKQGVAIWKKEVFAFVFVSQVPKTTMLDLHMMVAEPEQWVQPCADAGGNMYTFHIGELLMLTTFTLIRKKLTPCFLILLRGGQRTWRTLQADQGGWHEGWGGLEAGNQS